MGVGVKALLAYLAGVVEGIGKSFSIYALTSSCPWG